MLKYEVPLMEANFLQRLNRFSALVEINGQPEMAYVPNSGRMRELLLAGQQVFVQYAAAEHRRTSYDLVAVDYQGVLVSIDSRVPNNLMEVALQKELIPDLQPCRAYQREKTLGDSRIDFFVRTWQADWFLETKSVTLVEAGVARFPDAPTQRGTRHLRELAKWVQQGGKGMVAFLIQRPDAVAFTPNDATDPAFGQALREVVNQGVQAKAWICQVSPAGISLAGEIPVQV